MSSGRESGIVAITPPDQYPQAVWDEFGPAGQLKKTSLRLYELVGP